MSSNIIRIVNLLLLKFFRNKYNSVCYPVLLLSESVDAANVDFTNQWPLDLFGKILCCLCVIFEK